MSRRRPGLAARLTEPVAWADPALNALADWGERHPKVYWPIDAPDPRRRLDWRYHSWVVAMSLAGTLAVEAGQARTGTKATGVQLQTERAFSLVVGTVAWVMATGAWERRAAALRPWWRRG